MAGKKSGLGRGLDALFPEKVSQEKPKNQTAYQFTTVKDLPVTSVKNQSK